MIKDNMLQDATSWAKFVEQHSDMLANLAEGPGITPTWEVWCMTSVLERPILFKVRQVRLSDRHYKKGLDKELDMFYECVEAFVDMVEKVYGESFCKFVQAGTAEEAWLKVKQELAD